MSRHLGLVQAGERPDLDAFLARAADWVEADCDLEAILAAAAEPPSSTGHPRVAVGRRFRWAPTHLQWNRRNAADGLSWIQVAEDQDAFGGCP